MNDPDTVTKRIPTNEFGFPQIVDVVAVDKLVNICGCCLNSYTNCGGGTFCEHCRNRMEDAFNEEYEYEKEGGFDHLST